MIVDYINGQIVISVDAENPPNVLGTFLPGLRTKRQGRGKPWLVTCPATAFHFECIVKHRTAEWTEAAKEAWNRCAEVRARIVSSLKSRPFAYNSAPFNLFAHQQQAIDAYRHRGHRGLLGDEMGLGKTQVAISCFLESKANRLLVVCPASIKWKWQKELRDNGVDSSIPNNKTPLIPDRPAIIVNYDLLALRAGLVEDLAEWSHDAFVILDESHYVKNPSSKRSVAVARFKPRHLLLLTGTPVRDTILDLYHQITLVEPWWRSRWEFEDRYLIKRPKQLGKQRIWETVGTKNESELQEILSHVMIRRLKSEVMDLPPKVYSRIDIELDEEAKVAYELMRDRWLYHFGDLPREMSILDQKARTAIEAALRLEQIAQGYLTPIPETIVDRLDPDRHTHGAMAFKNPAKLAWLREFIEECRFQKKKVVVFYKFNKTLEIACSLLGGLALTGAVPTAQRGVLFQEFQTGAADVFHIQIRIAEGFDLTAAQDVVMFGRLWAPAPNWQAEDRCHRIGQAGTVNVHLPIVRGTIESVIADRLERKGDVASLVLGDIRDAVMQGRP